MSSPTLCPTPILTVRDRLRGALWGLFVGDALAMPTHWYYDVAALRRDYGLIRDYQAPLEHHPNSIMSLASTGRAGRGSQEGEVVGGLILKGKKGYWGRPHTHYHRGMRRGDNTLNLLCVRVLLRRLTATGGCDPVGFLRDYIAFMTAPDRHNDTYAESYHRDFFANHARGLPPGTLCRRGRSRHRLHRRPGQPAPGHLRRMGPASQCSRQCSRPCCGQ